jgi:hypothetical protein
MELAFWWMFIPITLAVVLAVITGVLIGIRTKKGGGVAVAHTRRLRALGSYMDIVRSRRTAAIVGSIIALVIIAAATLTASRPIARSVEDSVQYNRDVVICLDVSGSMIETDVAIIEKFKVMLDGFDGERISLVVFNSVAAQVFPLTDDYDYINEQLDYVYWGFFIDPPEPGYDFIRYTVREEQGGSLIADGLSSCVLSFEFSDPDRSRSVILATDNVPNGESIVDIEEAFGFAANRGVTVYSINPGSVEFETGVPLPEQEEELKRFTESTGGLYFELNDPSGIPAIVDSISQDTTTAIRSNPVISTSDDPNFVIWLLVALTLPALVVLRRAGAR